MMKVVKILIVVLVVTALGLSGWWYLYAQNGHKTRFRTVKAERGELLATINATGTLEPEEVIDIGAQVAGMIKKFGDDPNHSGKTIDYGSEVNEGTVLAEIDKSLYQAAYDQAKADLSQTKANVLQAKANLIALKAKEDQAERDWERVQKLGPTKALSDLDFDTAKSTWETAHAAVPGGEAALKMAEAAVESAQAKLNTAKTNLDYCTIKSPVKGVIIDRRVNIGQTVVASLSAPSLFLLAKDLKKIQVWTSVNEADIDHIKVGQPARFSVDAIPGKKFEGTVIQKRLNATMVQNVVTYTVVVSTDNSEGRLLPYMTANVDFEIDRKTDVLRVPNAALRWQPAPQQVVPDARADFVKAMKAQKGAPGEPQPADAKKKDTHDHGRVWVQDGEFVRPVKVRIGLSDGVQTEITGGDLQDGQEVVVGEIHDNAGGGTSNPFTPQLFKKN